MASSYMLSDKVMYYEVKVCCVKRGRKIIERKKFTDYYHAMDYMDVVEAKYSTSYIIEFNTRYM